MKRILVIFLFFMFGISSVFASGCENLKLDNYFYEKNCTIYKIGDERVEYSYGQISKIGDREVRYLRNNELYKIGDERVEYSYGQISKIGDREVRYLR